MAKTFAVQLREEFDLPAGLATWVAVTHVWVQATPLVMIWAIIACADALPTPFASVTLAVIASAVYMAATAFEVAQNSADRWYLTEATRSVADLIFNCGLTLSFCLYTIAFTGLDWLAWIAIAITAAYPALYVRTTDAHRGIGGIVVLIATLSLFFVTRDPAVWLFMVGNYIGAFLIATMLRTGSQWLHGWGAFMFGVGYLAWPLALFNAADGTPMSWSSFGIITLAAVIVVAALLPLLRRLQRTPRQFG